MGYIKADAATQMQATLAVMQSGLPQALPEVPTIPELLPSPPKRKLSEDLSEEKPSKVVRSDGGMVTYNIYFGSK